MVLKALGDAVFAAPGVEHFFSGMSERGMAEIVTQPDGLDKVFIETEGASDCACDLGCLKGVGKAGAEMVTLGGEEDLGFVFESTEGFRVEDAVTVALEGKPDGTRGFRDGASAGIAGMESPFREDGFLAMVERGDDVGF